MWSRIGDPSLAAPGFIAQHAQHSADWDWGRLSSVAVASATRVVGPDRAADAAQEALIRAWQHAGACRTVPGPWVSAISRREALRLVARDARRPHDGDRGEEAVDPPCPDALDVRDAVRRLGPADRSLVLRFYWLGERDREIADALALPLGTVKIRLHRARGRLRELLAAA
jgi:RNA polymerase sigma-70 factor (ECF subfamily)